MAINKDGTYTGYIYKITNLINGKIYIGQTIRTIECRWSQHKRCQGKRNHLYSAFDKYGIENFKIEEISHYTRVTKEKLIQILNKKEIYYIAKYNSTNPDIGYNFSIGGNSNIGTCLATPVDVYDIDGKLIGSYGSATDAADNLNVGKGEAQKCCKGETLVVGKKYVFRYKGEPFDKYDLYHYKRSTFVYQFDLNGNFIRRYDNYTQAALAVTGNRDCHVGIKNCAIGENKTAYNYYWSTDKNFNFTLENYRNRIPVDKYDFDGNYVCTYSSLSDASMELFNNLSGVCNISLCCKGESSQAYNYIWRFKDEPFVLNDKKIRLPRIQIDQYSIDGKLLNTFDSFQDALRYLDKRLDQGCNIRMCCNGESPIRFGYVWRYHGDSFDKYPVYKKRGGSDKPVDQYTIDGKFVKTYSSAKAAAIAVGLKNGTSVSLVCRGERKSAKGYLWRYHNEMSDK